MSERNKKKMAATIQAAMDAPMDGESVIGSMVTSTEYTAIPLKSVVACAENQPRSAEEEKRNIERLAVTIVSDGNYASDKPIVVERAGKKYKILRGNCRTGALRSMSDTDRKKVLAAWGGDSVPAIIYPKLTPQDRSLIITADFSKDSAADMGTEMTRYRAFVMVWTADPTRSQAEIGRHLGWFKADGEPQRGVVQRRMEARKLELAIGDTFTDELGRLWDPNHKHYREATIGVQDFPGLCKDLRKDPSGKATRALFAEKMADDSIKPMAQRALKPKVATDYAHPLGSELLKRTLYALCRVPYGKDVPVENCVELLNEIDAILQTGAKSDKPKPKRKRRPASKPRPAPAAPPVVAASTSDAPTTVTPESDAE